MKKLVMCLIFSMLFALAGMATSFAGGDSVSPATGDASVYVIIALVVAAVAIIGTVIYTKFKK